MTTPEDLEALSSKELHDRAVKHARRHLNVKFFWRLMQAIPAAEAGTGHEGEAMTDVQSSIARLDDLTDAGEGEVADALRPLYIEYLVEHDA